MVKSHGKSSATSATRKKHAKKVATALGVELSEASKGPTAIKAKNKEKSGRGKKDKKEPRVKVYIPPVKPARVQPDPLDVGGLARRLPPELVVVLRNVGKKAQVTKVRALEELSTVWVDGCVQGEGEGSDVVGSLVEMVPAWVHYIPPLFVHPSRRVRLLAASVHAGLLKIREVRERIMFHLREIATSEEVESVLGSWCVLAHDVERSVGVEGRESWDGFVRCGSGTSNIDADEEDAEGRSFFVLNESPRSAVFSFVQRTVLDPLGVYAYLNPPQPSAPTPVLSVANSRNQRSGGGGTGKGGGVNKQQQLAAAIAAARKAAEDGEPVRAKAEEYEENEGDRGARLRIGGVGGLKWFLELDQREIGAEVMELLRNPALWTVLHHGDRAPFIAERGQSLGSFGFAQPAVRKTGWGLLMRLMEAHKERLQPLVPILGSAVLRSAWVEPDALVQAAMWQPLLMFIKDFPNCWDLELIRSYSGSEEDEEESECEEDEDEDEEKQKSEKKILKPSMAYQDFLQFLQLGCSGSPIQGYPTVVIVLSTIPSSIIASSGTRTPLEDLFTSLWAALDGRALSSLHRAATAAAFLSAVLECAVFMARRLISDGTKEDSVGSVLVPCEGKGGGVQGARKLVTMQFGKMWDEIKSGRLKVEERAGARLVAQNLEVLAKVGGGLFDIAWGVLATGLRESTKSNTALVATFLKVLSDHFREGMKERECIRGSMRTVLSAAVNKVDELMKMGEDGVEGARGEVKFLESMLEQFREGLFEDESFAKTLDEAIANHAAILLASSPSLLFLFLAHRKDKQRTLELWHTLLGVITSAAANTSDPEATKKGAFELTQAAKKGRLPEYLRPEGDDMDGIMDTLLGNVLTESVNADVLKGDLEVVRAVLGASEYFISRNGYLNCVEAIATALNLRVGVILGEPKDDVGLSELAAPLELLDLVMRVSEPRWKEGLLEEVLLNVFLLGYLIPECSPFGPGGISSVFDAARGIWEQKIRNLGMEQREGIVDSVKIRLGDMLSDAQSRPLPEDILRVLAVQGHELKISLLHDVFPSLEALDGMLRQLPHDPIDSSLGVTEPLISSNATSTTFGPDFTDIRGFSSYARIVHALLQVFSEDRKLARQSVWALRHFIALSIYASDYQKVPAGVSPVFGPAALGGGLSETIGRAQQVTTYLFLGSLANGVRDGWRQRVVKRVAAGEYSQGDAELERFVEDVLRVAVDSDSVLDTRVLGVVLEEVLDDVDAGEAEEWVGLAKKLEKSAPQTSMVIIAAITDTGAEPPRLDRYRNEQAAALLGIQPSKVNTEGLLTLRRLAASAPDLDSDVVFLPQIRAVNVIKACQGWVTAEEGNVDEEVESTMTLLFRYLAPILQNVPGAHWEFIWDLLENNLELSPIADDSALVALARSLRLVITMEDLVKANKTLRVEWEQRRANVLKMVRDLALVKLETVSFSLPRLICRELVLTILRDTPASLMDECTLAKMCHLITEHSGEVQKMAYSILRTASKKRTEYLVIEAGVDTESTFKATIPPELLDIVQRHVNLTNLEDEDGQQNVFGSLLGWMLVFDLFQEASFKVKSGYIEQLRNLDLIATNFIPSFLTILRLEEGLLKAFKLDPWAVNEFYIDLFELGNSISIPLLMAHLYYRALLSVPSLVYSWLSDCKDRQLSTTVTTYTSQHFSPVLIDTELAHVKGPVGQELSDDSMSVKVASVVNEVLASYLVDEHQLEIKFKIPSDWPLHKIEVKDMKRVGVDENRWRAWILAVQQTIWSHNGRITDGLSLFKKNVTLHFEGQVECAICYSIISVMDGSLPKKPCKTCKNKFHAGCLYKWFNTSHSSSCPLCRSDFI